MEILELKNITTEIKRSAGELTVKKGQRKEE